MVTTYVNGKAYDDFSFVEEVSDEQLDRLAECMADLVWLLLPAPLAGLLGTDQPRGGAQSAGEIAVHSGLTTQDAWGTPPMRHREQNSEPSQERRRF